MIIPNEPRLTHPVLGERPANQNPIRYLSVCSGMEAATVAWHPLGWTPVGFSEIEPFPCAILAHRFPNVPNFGDMTKFKEWPIEPGSLDLIVAGTPCQAFSVAGLRQGLNDPRGNLTLVFLGIIERFKPRYVVWENVPGVLSEKTGALKSFLDGLSELGYLLDIDLCDAQYFGVPQRRKRIFVVARSLEDTIQSRTPSSALTIAQCLIETLHGICLAGSSRFANERISLESAALSADGARERMRLFGLFGESCNFQRLLSVLEDAKARFPSEQRNSASSDGESHPGDTLDALLRDFATDDQSSSTVPSLREALEGVCDLMKSFITSTSTRTITDSEISMCSKAVLRIGQVICHLRHSSPSSSGAVSSFLNALLDYTNYATQTSDQLLERLEWLHNWDAFHRKAGHTFKFVRDLGNGELASSFLFEPDCVRRDTKKGKQAGQGPAARAQGGVGADGVGPYWDGGDRTTTLTAKGGDQRMPDKAQFQAVIQPISHWDGGPHPTLNQSAKGSGAIGYSNQELFSQGGGGLVPSQPIPYRKAKRAQSTTDDETWVEGQVSNTLNNFDLGDTRTTHAVVEPIPLQDGREIEKKQNGLGIGREGDPSYTIDTTGAQSVVAVQGTIIGRGENAGPQGTGASEGGPMFTLTKADIHGVAHPVTFQPGNLPRDAGADPSTEATTTLKASAGDQMPHVAYPVVPLDGMNLLSHLGEAGENHSMQNFEPGDPSFTLKKGGNQHGVLTPMAVRRLTPIECERLQGFPDNWSRIPWRGKPEEDCPDGPRYKACGNSMAVPCMFWIGERIQKWEESK